MPTALVTGASSGIGKAFATRLAASGYELVLVARDVDALAAVAADLEHRFGGAAEVLAADLGDRDQLQTVADRVAAKDRPVDILVNAAGHALRTPFLANDASVEERLLDVHVRATLVLTHAAVRVMAERGGGGVINVSSVAAWVPRGTYSAHKAWVVAFSQAVAGQVAHRGVRVMALAPGYVRTQLHDRAGLRMQKVPAAAWLDADEVAAEALRAFERGTPVHVSSLRYRAATTLLRLAPHATIQRLRARRPR